MQPPTLTPLSSSAIRVNWTEPAQPNGVITCYGVYQTSLDGSQRTLVFISSEIGSYDAEGLEPFTEYSFLIEACTVEGCSESDPASQTTLESGEYGIRSHKLIIELCCLRHTNPSLYTCNVVLSLSSHSQHPPGS